MKIRFYSIVLSRLKVTLLVIDVIQVDNSI